MHPKLRHLLNQHIVASFHKQLHLQELVGDRAWSFDLPSGTLFFGEYLSFTTQVLGTESEQSKSWLWAWANEASGIPPEFVRAAKKMRSIGTTEGIEELMASELPSKSISAYDLAMVATGMFGAGAFYRGPYDGGAIWLILVDERLAKRQQVDAAKAVSLFTQAIMDLPITDHSLAFKGYMQWLEWPYEKAGTSVLVKDPAGTPVTAEFDPKNRLVALRAG